MSVSVGVSVGEGMCVSVGVWVCECMFVQGTKLILYRTHLSVDDGIDIHEGVLVVM